MSRSIDQPDDGKIRLPRTDAAMNKVAPAADRKDERTKTNTKSKTEKDKAILARARKRFDKCVGREADNRKRALECLNFINNKQWSEDDLKARQGRPTITENHLRVFVNQVANGQRENRPAINISPDGDRGDVQVAKMLKGVIRKLQRECNADIAYDTGYWNACAMGWGWWSVSTDYENPESFDQVIEINRKRNPFTIYADPSCTEPEAANMKFAFETEMMDRSDFVDKYPDADPMNFEGVNSGETYKHWIDEKQVRVAAYWEVTYDKTKLYELSNGWVGTDDEMHDDVRKKIDAGTLTIANERETEIPKVKYYKITAKDILERKDWPGKWIPLVRVVGNEIDIEGKLHLSGVINDAIDPQRRLNYWSSLETELLGLQTKAPWVMAEGQQEGHEDEWAAANTRPMPYILYKPTTVDDKVVPPPQRQPMPGVPAGLVEGRNAASQAMMATTGIRFDATMHERLNDESGRALHQIRSMTDIGTYHFIDNHTRALIQTGRILIDLIPKIYETKRILTIIRDDDKEEQVQLDPNQSVPSKDVPHPAGDGRKLTSINPKSGRYSVTVTTGPSYATKRIEAAQSMAEFARAMPQVAMAVADLIAKNQDWPDADVFAARLAKLVPPQLRDMPELKKLPPDAQALIGSLQGQVQQLGQHRMILMKALTDQNADRALKKDKIDKDFEAKLLGIFQKALASHQQHIGSKLQDMIGESEDLRGALEDHAAAVSGLGEGNQ